MIQLAASQTITNTVLVCEYVEWHAVIDQFLALQPCCKTPNLPLFKMSTRLKSVLLRITIHSIWSILYWCCSFQKDECNYESVQCSSSTWEDTDRQFHHVALAHWPPFPCLKCHGHRHHFFGESRTQTTVSLNHSSKLLSTHSITNLLADTCCCSLDEINVAAAWWSSTNRR